VVGRIETELDALRVNAHEIEQWQGRAGNPSLDRHDQTVLAHLLAALEEVREEFVIRPDDCLIVDNARMVHGRSAVEPHGGRILQRVWVGW
jgi:alpha-ketoglutarate-dependent taurine dioxygenase